MGSNTRLEDVTVSVSTVTPSTNIAAISFPNGTATTAKVRTTVINSTNTAPSGPGYSYGIYANDTTSSSAVTSFNAVQRTTINTSSTGGGVCRGVINTGSSYFSVRDSTIYSTGSSDSIGVENTGATGFTSIKTSSINGATNDILRTSGNLLITSTDLVNSTCDNKSFTVGIAPSRIYFGTYSTSVGIYVNGTYNLCAGTINIADNKFVNEVPIFFPQKVTVFAATCTASVALTGAQTVTFAFKLGAVPQYSIILNNGSGINVSNTSNSFTIPTTDHLSVTATFASNVPNTVLFTCSVSIY